MIELMDVSKDIRGRRVLDNINFKFTRGNIYGIFGPNGSGKTMLFRIISGLVKPSKGKIIIDGKELHRDISFPESLGLTIEGGGFWDYYTGFENLRILADIRDKIDDEIIDHTLSRVGLDPDDERLYREYSLGMKQRLAIAQAIMEKPEIILLDEPTSALDRHGTDLIRQIILEECERGATILMASHIKEDLDLTREQIELYEGKIVGRYRDE